MEALQFTTIMALLDNHSKRLQLLESALLDYDGFPPDGAEEAPPLPPVDIDRWFVTMTPQEFRDIRQGLLLTQRELASELGYRHKIRISEYERATNPVPIPQHIADAMRSLAGRNPPKGRKTRDWRRH